MNFKNDPKFAENFEIPNKVIKESGQTKWSRNPLGEVR